jgi:hypothetical protein
MPDYIKSNSKRCVQELKCSCKKFQSYNAATMGEDISICTPISCNITKICNNNNYKYQKYVLQQQNLYALMRRRPEIFPIISSVKNIGLTPAQQKAYSNLWYRQFGTSQALPVNDNFGGFYLVGSEVPYTN